MNGYKGIAICTMWVSNIAHQQRVTVTDNQLWGSIPSHYDIEWIADLISNRFVYIDHAATTVLHQHTRPLACTGPYLPTDCKLHHDLLYKHNHPLWLRRCIHAPPPSILACTEHTSFAWAKPTANWPHHKQLQRYNISEIEHQAQTCADAHGFDWGKLNSCANGAEGDALFVASEYYTDTQMRLGIATGYKEGVPRYGSWGGKVAHLVIFSTHIFLSLVWVHPQRMHRDLAAQFS
jgi:hypothetical protein